MGVGCFCKVLWGMVRLPSVMKERGSGLCGLAVMCGRIKIVAYNDDYLIGYQVARGAIIIRGIHEGRKNIARTLAPRRLAAPRNLGLDKAKALLPRPPSGRGIVISTIIIHARIMARLVVTIRARFLCFACTEACE